MTESALHIAPPAPVADARPTTRTHHGDEVVDRYEWLRAKEDPAVIAHLEAENAYTDERTSHLAALRQTIFDEIRSRTQETDLSVPTRQGSWWYYGRTVEGKQYGIHCRAPLTSPDDWTPPTLQPGVDVAGEVVLLDGNVEADGHEFFSLGSFDVSADGARLLYGVDVEGDERYTLRVRDLISGADLGDVVENTSSGACFSPDGRFVVYTTVDDAWRPDTVWLHEVGTDASADIQLFHEPDERYWVGAGFTRSERYLVIGVGSSITTEEYLVDASDLRAAPRVVWPRREGVEYSVSHAVVGGEDVFYVLHNDGALDFELVRVPASDPGERDVVLPHTPGRRLLDVSTFRDWAVVSYRRDGLARVGILSYETGEVDELDFDEELYAAGTTGNPEWAPPVVRLGYGSFVTPGTVYDYVVGTGEFLLRKRQPVLGGYSPDLYAQRRDWVTASDGARVPVSLVWKRSFGDPGTGAPRPVHLYGYGSYEHSIEPGFSVARLSMLDRGVVFAVAHVRGGGEMGRQWYEDGKLTRKRNSFTDFVAVAQHLVDAGVTTPSLLVAEGGSAGGLLMGAVANLAPELFAGILADVPFVDALTTILDPSLPLTVIEWDEWGDPLHDAEVYEYMKSYTPYENVRPGIPYPRILATTSLNDTRVYYVEPAKWVARLREAGVDALLRCEMVAGHGGVSGRYNSWRQRSFELAWLLDVLGLAEE
ncbi:MAG: S9 family peptidase [Microbacterium sp.]